MTLAIHDAHGAFANGLSRRTSTEIDQLLLAGRRPASNDPVGQDNAGDRQHRQRHYTREFHAQVAKSRTAEQPFLNGRHLAERLRYPRGFLDRLPLHLVDTFIGLGNPFSMGAPLVGAVVVDVGCGAGFDALVSGHHVGSSGLVFGVDITKEMVQRASKAAAEIEFQHVHFIEGTSEELPLAGNIADLVTSNGVFNLGDREQAIAECHRVLKPGGRLQFADAVWGPDLPHADLPSSLLLRSAQSNRLTCQDWRELLTSVGLVDVEVGPESNPYRDDTLPGHHRPRVIAATKPT